MHGRLMFKEAMSQMALLADPTSRQTVDVDALQAQVDNVQNGLNVVFVLFSAYLVFVMQIGFAMLTAGAVRTKNTKNVLLKNVLDACVGAVAYYISGFAFAFGNTANSFIGHSDFCLSQSGPTRFWFWFFQWTFAATAATIVSGSVAERASFYAYLGYAFFLTSFVYPVVSHWVWASAGWLNVFNPDAFSGGMIDFAGSAVVHSVGGWAGLMGAIIVGPRTGRFDSEGNVVPMPGHSATLCCLGTFLLWFGWYGFNPGSALAVMYTPSDTGTILTIARACVTTTLATAVGGLTALLVIKIKDHIFDLSAVLNGALSGAVGITASCALTTPYLAVVIGILSPLVFISLSMLLQKLKIDDPLDAFPLHAGAGAFGALAVGFVGEPLAMADAGFPAGQCGVMYGCNGKLLLANFVGWLCIVVWTCGLLGPFFLVLKLAGLLRIPVEDELIGNDISKHGGSAYPEDGVDAANKMAAKDLAGMRDNLGVDDSLKKPAEGEAQDAPVEMSPVPEV